MTGHIYGDILALDCEKVLMRRIKDVAEKGALLAIPNKRPEGAARKPMFL
jgi:hypothetical protein